MSAREVERLRAVDWDRIARVLPNLARGQRRHPDTAAALTALSESVPDIRALIERLAAAETAVERVRALADRWDAEAVERGPEDRLYTSGVAGMLNGAIKPDLRAALDPEAGL